jgi:HEPN domain-containing protein
MIQPQIIQQFESLIGEGKSIMSQSGWDGREWLRFPSMLDYLRFRTRGSNLISRVCGVDSVHYKELDNISKNKEMSSNSYYFHMCYGVIEAAYQDYKEGLLFDLRSLISAELLGDFTTQAEVLLESGYYIPAASLIGAVLEDSLRRLSDKNGISYPEKTKIDQLNSELARAGIYNKLVQKEITAKADIRNNADHGKHSEFSEKDVEEMIKWVRRFESDYLG